MNCPVPLPRIVVLASGRGSNFEAIARAFAANGQPSIAGVVSNTEGAGVLEKAAAFGVPGYCIPHQGLTRDQHEGLVLKLLDRLRPDWLVLAGYMRIFSADFVARFWDDGINAARIVNIHPSLLPSFPGKDAYQQAFDYGVAVTGATVHLVSRGIDDGPILAQRAFEIAEGEDATSIEARGLALEHDLYPQTLLQFFSGSLRPRPRAGVGREAE